MIRTDKQLEITLKKIEDFNVAISELEEQKANIEPLLYQVQSNALNNMLSELKKEVEEYNDIKNCPSDSYVFGDIELDCIPEILIKARLIKKMSQAELAKKLEVAPQQIQRYESTEYSGVKHETLIEIVNALDLNITCRAMLIPNNKFDKGEKSEEQILELEHELRSQSLFEVTV